MIITPGNNFIGGEAKIGSAASFVGLLNLYPNAQAAYSTRLLDGEYTGPCMRVRRSSDNAEQDIFFTVTGHLNEAALLSFVGSGIDGYVVKWYDQSGNGNNAVQTTAINQPQIVSIGSIINLNSKPAIYWDSSDFFSFDSLIDSTSGDSSMFLAYKLQNTGNAAILIDIPTNGWHFLNYVASSLLGYGTNFIIGNPFQVTDYILVSVYNKVGVKLEWFKNNASSASLTSPVSTLVKSSVFPARVYGTSPMYATELIIYNLNQENNINDIDQNINTYFEIYE